MTHPLDDYYKEERPWGSFERFILNEKCSVKIMKVSARKRFSLQKHEKREEFWRVLEGSGTLELDGEMREVTVGDEILVKVGMTHRLTGGENGISFLEIWIGEGDEDDVIRIEDDFGRA